MEFYNSPYILSLPDGEYNLGKKDYEGNDVIETGPIEKEYVEPGLYRCNDEEFIVLPGENCVVIDRVQDVHGSKKTVKVVYDNIFTGNRGYLEYEDDYTAEDKKADKKPWEDDINALADGLTAITDIVMTLVNE